MKLNVTNNRKAGAFTLIEMIGVLAVIAILAALLIPRVFNAINDARVNSVIVGAQTVKTATIQTYANNGRFDATNNMPVTVPSTPWSGYDTNVLMAQGLLDKPFLTKAGTNSYVQLISLSGITPSTAVTGNSSGAYSLQGVSGQNDVTGTYVVECVVEGVAEADAQTISQRIDGATMSQTAFIGDSLGRVKYSSSGGGPVDVHIYLAHR